MLAKVVALFLVVIAVLGIFGKLRLPSVRRSAGKTCPHCGRHMIGKGPCACRKGKG